MKTFITVGVIVGLLVAGTVFAWVEPLQIYERFAQIPEEKVDIYKVVDEDVTCYVAISPLYSSNNNGKNQSISCVINK